MQDVIDNVLPLALGAAVSPILLTFSVLCLASGGGSVKLRSLTFIAGVLTVLVAIGVVGLTTFNNTVSEHDTTTNTTSAWISLIAGVVLLVLFVRRFMRRREPSKSHRDLGASLSPLRVYLIGCIGMLTNVTSLVLYIPLLKEVARAHIAEADKLLVLLGSIAIISLPATVPLAITLVTPRNSQRVLAAINGWVTRNSHTIMLVILLVFGVYLVVKGASKL